jgi:hypothetical protein
MKEVNEEKQQLKEQIMSKEPSSDFKTDVYLTSQGR